MSDGFSAYHLLIWRIDGMKVRLFGELDDETFTRLVADLGLTLPRGCYFVHIPKSEVVSGGKRMDAIRALPVVELESLQINDGHIVNLLYRELCAGRITASTDLWRERYEKQEAM